MRPLSGVLVLATLLSFAAAGADECVPTTSDPELDADTAFGRLYVDNDPCQLGLLDADLGWEGDGCLFSIWIYQESNGIDGLQRRDEVRDDTCGGEIEGDTLPS